MFDKLKKLEIILLIVAIVLAYLSMGWGLFSVRYAAGFGVAAVCVWLGMLLAI